MEDGASEFASLLAELHHMNAENQRLRKLVDQVSNEYDALHKQLMKLMQKPHKHEVIYFYLFFYFFVLMENQRNLININYDFYIMSFKDCQCMALVKKQKKKKIAFVWCYSSQQKLKNM